jgi:AcrR family transcriptional regulator
MEERAPNDLDSRPASARRRILAAAREILRDDSFAQLKIERVAARAGLTRRTVYNQFDDRDALYQASRLELLQAFEFDLPSEVPPAREPLSSLEAFFREALEVFMRAEHVELQASLLRDGATLPWLTRTYQLRVERPLRITLESWLLSDENPCSLPPSEARFLSVDGVEMLKSSTWRNPQPAFTCRELSLIFLDRLRARHQAAANPSAPRDPDFSPGLL